MSDTLYKIFTVKQGAVILRKPFQLRLNVIQQAKESADTARLFANNSFHVASN